MIFAQLVKMVKCKGLSSGVGWVIVIFELVKNELGAVDSIEGF